VETEEPDSVGGLLLPLKLERLIPDMPISSSLVSIPPSPLSVSKKKRQRRESEWLTVKSKISKSTTQPIQQA
jgi:hypothetical protein